MPYTYIIYSRTIDRFYIGSTSDDINERVRKHNSKHKGYTARANDWTIVHVETFDTIQQARSRERQIKSWKSRVMIERLCNFKKL
ncbi:GIY-YIG nuclease family protein [Tenuifilum sp.]|jgi:putative endonuclease|uniref:GIY-YIG nuclease family protein n=1 Tax=Tenuifilum sp. TaxID=2760880 RepID=UPI00338DF004